MRSKLTSIYAAHFSRQLQTMHYTCCHVPSAVISFAPFHCRYLYSTRTKHKVKIIVCPPAELQSFHLFGKERFCHFCISFWGSGVRGNWDG